MILSKTINGQTNGNSWSEKIRVNVSSNFRLYLKILLLPSTEEALYSVYKNIHHSSLPLVNQKV